MAHKNYSYLSINERHDNGASNHATEPGANPQTFSNRMGQKPKSLSSLALIGFGLLFLCAMIALVILRYLAHRQNGFNLVTDNQYTWVFGPTAILVIIISFWRKVDYHCRALQPWSELDNGPATADRTILLDHISPFQLVALYNAITKRHFSVVATISGSLVLKLITIASTGLLAPVTFESPAVDADMRYTRRFINGSYNASLYYNALDSTISDPAPIYMAYAIMDKGYELPNATADNLIYEAFEPTLIIPNTTYGAVVKAFVPEVTCEAVTVDLKMESGAVNTYYQNDSSWICPSQGPNMVSICEASTIVCPPRSISYQTIPSLCNYATGQRLNLSDPYLIMLADIRYHQTWNQSLSNVSIGDELTPASWNVEWSTVRSAMCEVSYSMREVNVTYNLNKSAIPTVSLQHSNPIYLPLKNFNNNTLLDQINLALDSGAPYMFGGTLRENYYDEQPPNTLLKLMSIYAGGDYQTLLDDEDTLVKSAEYVLTQIAMQIGRKQLMQTDDSIFTGQQSYLNRRLQVQEVAVLVMVAGFAVMLLLTIVVAFIDPVQAFTGESAMSIAEISVRSADLMSTVHHVRHYNEKEAGLALEQHRYYAQVGSHNEHLIRVEKDNVETPAETGTLKWWAPITISKPFLATTICLPLIIIALLEGLQHLSDSSQGFATVQNSASFTSILYTRFLPALIVLVIATAFNSLDFNASVIAPFSALRARPRGPDVMSTSFLTHLPPIALFKALKHQYWIVCLTMTASLIGSLLTIIVSGLYTIDGLPLTTTTELRITDTWNLSVAGSSLAASGTAAVVSLVESANLTYPLFTYGDLTFPTLALADLNSTYANVTGIVTAQVSALRSNLACTDVPMDQIDFRLIPAQEGGSDHTVVYIETNITLPDGCRGATQYGNGTYVPALAPPFRILGNDSRTYFGQFLDLRISPSAPYQPHLLEVGELDYIHTDNVPACPTIFMCYGYMEGNDVSRSGLTLSYCYQNVERVEVKLTLNTPSMTIPPEHPPVSIEDTAKLVSSGPHNETGFPWRTESDMAGALILVNANFSADINPKLVLNDTFSYTAGFQTVSNFFRAVLFGRTPIDPAIFFENKNPTQVFSHIQQFYGRYMAQVLSASMRIPINSTLTVKQKRDDILVENPATVSAKFQPTAGVLRLVQNQTPKIVLQVMLATMCICGLAAWNFGNLHDVVPWNPCTIAGIAVLFASSRNFAPHPETSTATKPHKSYGPIGTARSLRSQGEQSTSHLLSPRRRPSEIPSNEDEYPGTRKTPRLSVGQHDDIELDSLASNPRPSMSQVSFINSDTDTRYSFDDERISMVSGIEDTVIYKRQTGARNMTADENDTPPHDVRHTEDDADTHTEAENIVVPGNRTIKEANLELLSDASNRVSVTDPRIRLRLGWWQGGIFMGPRLPKSRVKKTKMSRVIRHENQSRGPEGWEYGIDVI